MDEDVVVSRGMLRAIGAETRISMLKALKARQKTQSELASELGIAAPTVLEHMNQLEGAGLIELVPEYAERKWKYYRLTKTAKNLVEGRRMNVIMLLASGSAAITTGLMALYFFVPAIIRSITGSSASTDVYTAPASGSGGIQHALSSLQASSNAFLGAIIMLFILLTLILAAAYAVDRFARKRL